MSLGCRLLEVVVEVLLVAELEGLGHHGVLGELGVDGLGGQAQHLVGGGLGEVLISCKQLVVFVLILGINK